MAERHDIVIDQGATYEETVEWVDSDGVAIPLTDYTARMQVRTEPDAADPPILDLTDGDGLTIDEPAGTVAIEIDAATTAALTPGRYQYDLEVESPAGKVTRLIQGFCTVDAEVTR